MIETMSCVKLFGNNVLTLSVLTMRLSLKSFMLVREMFLSKCMDTQFSFLSSLLISLTIGALVIHHKNKRE